MNTRPPLLAVLIASYFFGMGSSTAAETKFPVVSLTAGVHLIQAEVAATEAERAKGLMHRQKLGANEGMVFVFGAPATVCMWMKNTPLPLSVAFLDENGRIINIEDMEPNTETSHCAHKHANYALEMRQGWFKQKNLRSGTQIKGLPQ